MMRTSAVQTTQSTEQGTEPSTEQGAALLSVLLIVAVMSLTAITIMETVLTGLSISKSSDARARTQWHIIGAEQAGAVGLEQINQRVDRAFRLETPGLGTVFPLEVDGTVTLARLEEASNCFNLNSLRAVQVEGETLSSAAKNYRLLLWENGFSEDQANLLSDALADWLDSDNDPHLYGFEDDYYSRLTPAYRSAGTFLADISELRAIQGYTKRIVDQISPFVCVRPDEMPAVLNINTLGAEDVSLLKMVFSGQLSDEDAQNILAFRPLGGWADIEALLSHRAIEEIAPEFRQTSLLSIQSTYLALQTRIEVGDQITGFTTIYRLGTGSTIRRISRSIGGLL